MSSDELANAETLPGSGDEPVDEARLAPGTVLLDRYRIVRWLGAGGMGAVYAAHDTRLDQAVALKFVGGARREVERDRLREEVRTLQGLTHRGIARTYTFDEAAGEPFIVMELLAGETLAARIARGRLDEREAREVVGALAVALDEAHRAGVVHRDVKPANVMLCPGGRVVLMDFGLARSDEAPAPEGAPRSALMTTSLKGTPAYLAPEMALGRRVDARADLYSLGVLAYESLTGALPFEADSAKGMIDAHVARVPEDVRGKRPEISAAFGALIARLLAKDPDARPASAAAVIAAIAPRRSRRWPLLVGVGAVVLAGVLAFVVLRGTPTRRPAGDWDRLTSEQPQTLEVTKADFDRGQAAFQRGDYAEAISAWQRAYAIVPEPLFLFNLGRASELAKDYPNAALFYRRYLDLRPDLDAEEREAVLRRIEAMPRAASGALDAGLDEAAKAAYHRAEEAFFANDHELAYDRFMEAYDLSPRPEFLYDIAQAARMAGKAREALFFYRRYLDTFPDLPTAQRERAEQMIAIQQAILDQHPDAQPDLAKRDAGP